MTVEGDSAGETGSYHEELLDLDELLPYIDEFGKYQKQLLWLICLPACLPCGFCAFNQLFMADEPDHWCKVPELENLTIPRRKILAIPLLAESNDTFSQCERYDYYWGNFSENDMDLRIKPSLNTIPCDRGWEYADDDGTNSIVSEFDLVCGYSIYPTIGLAALNLGGPLGVYLFGNLNDRIGRKRSFFACLLTLIVGAVSTALACNFWIWAISRIIIGLTVPAIYQIPFIISLELVGPNYRSFVTVMTCIFYTIGLCLLAVLTYFVKQWRSLSLVTGLPFTTFFIFWRYLPESPRWLLATNRLEEAFNTLQLLAETNGKDIPTFFTENIRRRINEKKCVDSSSATKKVPNVSMLLKTPNMRTKTLLITLNWFANNMVYVGLSYYGPSMGNEEHISFFLSSLSEIPSYFLCWMVLDRWGRRLPLCIGMIIAGFSCIMTILLPEDAVHSTFFLFLLSKTAISASFLIIYPFAGELYPTEVRGTAIGFSTYISGVGLIVLPFITYLGTDNLKLPLLILGIISVIGGASVLRLPETLHQKLPQTLEEGEEFGKDITFLSCLQFGTTISQDILEESPEEPANYPGMEMEMTRINSNKRSFNSASMRKKFTHQLSLMDTQRDSSGSIQITYWF